MTTAYVSHSSFTEHDFPRHPEHAGRIRAVWEQLSQPATCWIKSSILRRRQQSDEQILAVHSRAHLDRLVSGFAAEIALRGSIHDTYALPQSPAVARLAAGAVVGAVDSVLGGAADNALAIVRPPGHHATVEWQMGFCLLNNVAIAARHAQARHNCGKVLIIDYDVHHGNGTQDIFYADPSVMFISIHQSPFYPGTGALAETGSGAGAGYTLNVPIAGGHGDCQLRANLRRSRLARRGTIRARLLLVSAGFDAHWVDPLAQMQLSLAGYDHLARECLRMAERLCGGKIVFVMEGGYDLEALWRTAGAI